MFEVVLVPKKAWYHAHWIKFLGMESSSLTDGRIKMLWGDDNIENSVNEIPTALCSVCRLLIIHSRNRLPSLTRIKKLAHARRDLGGGSILESIPLSSFH